MPHAFHLAALIWFTLAVTSRAVKLWTTPQVAARCGENVTLACIASSSDQIDKKLFSWVAVGRKVLCQYGGHDGDAEALCESGAEPEHSLNVTLVNIMPVHQGKYLCKLHSQKGMQTAATEVKIQECFGSGTSSSNGSHATCSYGGVYPDGEVHWHSRGADLTASAHTTKEKNRHDLSVITSTIRVQDGDSYNCSLWLPDAMKYVSRQELHVPGLRRSSENKGASGSLAPLYWLVVMVEIAIVSFMF